MKNKTLTILLTTCSFMAFAPAMGSGDFTREEAMKKWKYYYPIKEDVSQEKLRAIDDLIEGVGWNSTCITKALDCTVDQIHEVTFLPAANRSAAMCVVKLGHSLDYLKSILHLVPLHTEHESDALKSFSELPPEDIALLASEKNIFIRVPIKTFLDIGFTYSQILLLQNVCVDALSIEPCKNLSLKKLKLLGNVIRYFSADKPGALEALSEYQLIDIEKLEAILPLMKSYDCNYEWQLRTLRLIKDLPVSQLLELQVLLKEKTNLFHDVCAVLRGSSPQEVSNFLEVLKIVLSSKINLNNKVIIFRRFKYEVHHALIK